ncbi:MAG: RHS repeat-associated core domain-containing protein, partial [Mycobacteriales bacterium]
NLQRLTQAWSATDNCAGAPQTSSIGGPAPYWQSFSYDADGNRTGETDHGTSSGVADVIHTYTYPTGAGAAHPHAVQSVTTTGGPDSGKTDTYGYDATGNTTARNLATGTAGAQVLNWDVEGRLGSATVNGQTSSYLYDADGDLLIRHDAGGATLYLPDQEVHADNNGTLTGQRYYDCGDSLVALRTNAGLYWMLTDPQGTSTVAVDTSSQAVTRRYYTPFGQTRGTPSSNYPGDRGYVGGTTDSVTGLEHLGARDYDTSLGRFVSVDPVQDTDDVQQLEGYSYANNSPIAGSDPTGLWWGSHLWHKVKHAVTSHVSHWWNSGWSSFSNFWVHTYHAAVKKVKHIAKRVSHAWHSVTHRISHAIHHFAHTVTHYWHVARRVVHHYIHVTRGWVTKHVTKPLSHAYKVAKRWTSHAAAVASHAVASGAAAAWHATTAAASTVGAGIAVGATATWNWTKKNWRTVAGAAVFGVCVVASAGACFAAGVALAAVKLGADLYDGHSVRDSLKEFAIGVGFSALGYGAAKGLEPFVNGADVGALRPVESRLALAGGGDVGRSPATLGRTSQRIVSGLVTQGNNVINYVNNLYNATFTCGAPSGGPSYCG